MRKVILSVTAVLLGVTFVYAESCKDSQVKKEYKSDEANCSYQMRTCCEDGEWSGWDKECVSCECKEGATLQMLCSDYYGEPVYKGRVDVKCNKCKWVAIGLDNCYTPVFVKFVYNFSSPWYEGIGIGACPIGVQSPFKLYDEKTGALVVSMELSRLGAVGYWHTGSLSSEVIELKSDNDYYTERGAYDCIQTNQHQVFKIECEGAGVRYGPILKSNSQGGNAGNPIIEEYTCGTVAL